MSSVFVQVDWRNLEGRLTAYFSGDPALTEALENELRGGPKVHAINAGVIYGIDPGDADTHMVSLQGQPRPAYDAGKRLTHAWNYGMAPRKMAQQFWITMAEAERIDALLTAQYAGVADWRKRLAETVFGVPEFACVACAATGNAYSQGCPVCRAPYPPRFVRWLQYPEKRLQTPFGRRRLYLGRRGEGANALTSQLPQSCGASMWYRTLQRLHGFDVSRGEVYPWPTPEGALLWHPGESYVDLLGRGRTAAIYVVTGT